MATKIPLLAQDLMRLHWVMDLALSPDKKLVAYTLKDCDPREPETTYRYRIFVVSTENDPQEAPFGKALVPQFTEPTRLPRWAPDGQRLGFLAKTECGDQVFVMHVGTAAVCQITRAPKGVADFEWSPDGKRIAYIAEVVDEEEFDGEYVPDRYRVIRRLSYKTDGKGYWSGAWQQIFVVRVEDRNDATPEPQQITSGPSDHLGVRWSPDGANIAYISTFGENPDNTPLRHIIIQTVCGAVQSGPLRLTSTMVAQSLSWSPSSRYIAFLGHDNSEDRCTTTGLWVVRVSDGALVNLTADIDRPVGDHLVDDMNAEANAAGPSWLPDERAILTILSDQGRTWIARVNFPGDVAFDVGEAVSHSDERNDYGTSRFGVTPLKEDEHRVFAYSLVGETIALAKSEPMHPGDIFLIHDISLDADEKRLTAVNAELLAGRILASPEPMYVIASNGRRLGFWLLKPPHLKGPHPLVLHIHGGPHVAYSPVFNFELQHLAAEGYAVLYGNPHGSHTYGRDINMGTQHDWGGQDFDDLMKAVDQATQRSDVDPSRLGVVGGSYGGWMTNYIITRTSRFQAAVAQRSSSNRISTFTSSAMGFKHARWEAPGYPWEHIDYFVKISPVLHAHKVNTPLLLIHAEHDHLCPLTQAEEMFTALKILDKVVELVVFLGESHHLTRTGKPANRVEHLKRTAAWLSKHIPVYVPVTGRDPS